MKHFWAVCLVSTVGPLSKTLWGKKSMMRSDTHTDTHTIALFLLLLLLFNCVNCIEILRLISTANFFFFLHDWSLWWHFDINTLVDLHLHSAWPWLVSYLWQVCVGSTQSHHHSRNSTSVRIIINRTSVTLQDTPYCRSTLWTLLVSERRRPASFSSA